MKLSVLVCLVVLTLMVGLNKACGPGNNGYKEDHRETRPSPSVRPRKKKPKLSPFGNIRVYGYIATKRPATGKICKPPNRCMEVTELKDNQYLLGKYNCKGTKWCCSERR